MGTYDDWKLRSPDDEYQYYFIDPWSEVEDEPELLPLELDDLVFITPANGEEWEG